MSIYVTMTLHSYINLLSDGFNLQHYILYKLMY